MSAAPFMQLYVADYLGDTMHLTTEQHGAYLLLLMGMWRAGGKLPNEERILSRIVGLTPTRWRRINAEVLAFFDVEEGAISQKRLSEEIEKSQKKSRVRADAGRLGGEANALRTKGMAEANASVLPKHSSDIRYQKEEREEKGSPLPPSDPVSASPPPQPELLPDPGPVPKEHDDIVEAFSAYNAAARDAGWPVATKLTAPRRASLRKRLAECGGLGGWSAAMARARASPFLCGANDRGWRADLDFFLQASSFVRLMEGKYDDRQHRDPPDRTKLVSHTSAWASFAAEYADRGDAGGGRGLDADGNSGASGPDRRGQVDYLTPDPGDRRCDGSGTHGCDAGGYREPDGWLFGSPAFA